MHKDEALRNLIDAAQKHLRGEPSPLPAAISAGIAVLSDKESEGEPRKLEWSDVQKPNDMVPYHHVMAQTPFGRILITWKGWKDNPSFDIEEHPVEKMVYWSGCSLESTKAEAEEQYFSAINSVLASHPTASKEAALQDLREYHDACMKNAYELLGIDGSDGEYRYKWVALEIARLKDAASKEAEPLVEVISQIIYNWENGFCGADAALRQIEKEMQSGDAGHTCTPKELELIARGRAEALAIILQLDPETALDDCVKGYTDPAGEWACDWDKTALQKLLRADDSVWSKMQEAEDTYWHYVGLRDEMERLASNPAPGKQDEPLGTCCYGGLKTKKDCASCGYWNVQKPVPAAWFRGVQSGGSPDSPPEYDVDMVWQDWAPEGKGWNPLYTEKALDAYALQAIAAKPVEQDELLIEAADIADALEAFSDGSGVDVKADAARIIRALLARASAKQEECDLEIDPTVKNPMAKWPFKHREECKPVLFVRKVTKPGEYVCNNVTQQPPSNDLQNWIPLCRCTCGKAEA